MGFLNTNSMPRLVEKLADGDNIKITGNSKGNRVGTVVKKIVEKADDVTKAIEQEVINDSYSFKVGTGNVDVSADVEDGFGEIGVKGITLQNCYPPLTTSNFSTLNGTITSDGYVSMQGDGANWKNAWIDINKCLIKPNTTYTLVCYVLENTLVEGLNLTTASNQCVFRATNKVPAKTTGLLCYIATTIGDFTSVPNGLRSYLSNTETGKIVFKVMILEGDHTNNPNLPSYFEGIQGVGDKSKNLFNGKLEEGQLDSTTGLVVDFNGRCRSVDYIEVNKNTDYRIQIKSTETSSPWTTVFLYDSNKKYISYTQDSNGASNLTFNTGDAKYIKFKVNVKVSSITEVQIKKGNSDTPYEPYYDGHKIEILSNGKNLFKPDIVTDTKSYTLHTGNGYWGTVFKVKPNTDYRITSKSDGFNLTTIAISYVYFIGNGGGDCWIVHQTSNPSGDSEGIVNSGSKGEIYIRMPDYTFPIIPYMLIHRKIQIQEGTTGTTYTPYIEDKTQILLDEPLMRLPNGIHDEITRDGKLIRRVGKIVFDGTENWTGFKTHFEDFDEFSGNVGNHTILQNNSIVNNFPQTNNHRVVTAGNTTYIRLPKGIVNSLNECKQWLSQNPTTVYYELSTPIITELPAPYLRIFKDGHLTFNTLVAPESNHVVQLNKSAQIERSIREVQGLDSRVGQLESFYDDMMLETNHKLSLLDYDFEYTRSLKESEDI